MSIDVDIAIQERWVAAGLNTTIAPLYPGDDVPSPENTRMPRANYYSTSDPLESESKGTLGKLKTYTFEVWATTHELAGGYVKAIAAAFLNSEKAASNPLYMGNGKIMGTHEGDDGIEKTDDAVFRGYYTFTVRWRKPNAIPA